MKARTRTTEGREVKTRLVQGEDGYWREEPAPAPRRRQDKGRGALGAQELSADRGRGAIEFTDTPRGRRAADRWAAAYDRLNGAPESGDDR